MAYTHNLEIFADRWQRIVKEHLRKTAQIPAEYQLQLRLKEMVDNVGNGTAQPEYINIAQSLDIWLIPNLETKCIQIQLKALNKKGEEIIDDVYTRFKEEYQSLTD